MVRSVHGEKIPQQDRCIDSLFDIKTVSKAENGVKGDVAGEAMIMDNRES